MKSTSEIKEAMRKLGEKLDYYDEKMVSDTQDKDAYKRLYEETKNQIHLLRWVLND